MAYSFDWNAIFKAVPGDSDAISGGADAIRDLKEAIQERIAHDHYMTVGGTNADHGEHQKIIFHEPESSYPVPGENKGALYTKNVSDKAELHWTDEDGNNLPLTSGGELLAAVPSGGIILWSGASDDIPTGYYLCNGSNSTPDLRNSFIVGAGDTYAVGATGGEATHVLSEAEMPSHTHDIENVFVQAVGTAGNPRANMVMTGAALVTESAGSGDAHNNLPPYYALCYIMKS